MADIVRSFAKLDRQSQARLGMMGLEIYMACKQEEKAKLRAENTEGRLNLKGRDDDPTALTSQKRYSML